MYGKPFGLFIAGTEKNICSMDREQLLGCHRKIYVPENSVLAVVGNNSFEDVVKLAEKFCAGREGEVQGVPNIELQSLKGEERRGDLQQANVVLGFHFPTSCEKERYAAEVFSSILGSGMSSKLFREVREKRGLVYAVKTDLDLGKKYGYLIIYAGTEKSKVQEVIDICVKEFHAMGKLTKKELDEGKEQVIGNYEVGLEGSSDTALNLILEEVSGRAEDFYEYAKNVKKVSLADIKKLAGKADYSSFVLSP